MLPYANKCGNGWQVQLLHQLYILKHVLNAYTVAADAVSNVEISKTSSVALRNRQS